MLICKAVIQNFDEVCQNAIVTVKMCKKNLISVYCEVLSEKNNIFPTHLRAVGSSFEASDPSECALFDS